MPSGIDMSCKFLYVGKKSEIKPEIKILDCDIKIMSYAP